MRPLTHCTSFKSFKLIQLTNPLFSRDEFVDGESELIDDEEEAIVDEVGLEDEDDDKSRRREAMQKEEPKRVVSGRGNYN